MFELSEYQPEIIPIINTVFRIVAILLVMIVIMSVIQIKNHSRRMGWFIISVCFVMGGLISELASQNRAIFFAVSSESSVIRAHIFYALFAVFFCLYFIETEIEAGAGKDGVLWTLLHGLIGLLVVILSMADLKGIFEWLAFFLQYVIVIVMLFFSSKDVRASIGFILGASFPITAALLGMAVPGLDLMGAGLTIMCLIIFFGFQSDMERELLNKQVELSASKVSLLMEQIHPHFIYNSLQQIALLCDEDALEVKEAIYNFSGYLRKNFESLTNEGMISFDKEMEHVDMFVKLAMINPARKFEVRKDFKVTNFFLPALTIQPLVENAVQYGVGMGTGGGKIEIQTREEKSYITISVSDDGSGLENQMATQKKHKSVGMENVRMRLKLMCDGKMEFLQTKEGTKVIVRIPKNI